MSLRDNLAASLKQLDVPPFESIQKEMKVPWPLVSSKREWPSADIFLRINKHKVCIVETDDTTDPLRNIAKYWPLLHSIERHSFKFSKLLIITIIKKTKAMGNSYPRLASFVGNQMQALCPSSFEFHSIVVVQVDTDELARRVCEIIKQSSL